MFRLLLVNNFDLVILFAFIYSGVPHTNESFRMYETTAQRRCTTRGCARSGRRRLGPLNRWMRRRPAAGRVNCTRTQIINCQKRARKNARRQLSSWRRVGRKATRAGDKRGELEWRGGGDASAAVGEVGDEGGELCPHRSKRATARTAEFFAAQLHK